MADSVTAPAEQSTTGTGTEGQLENKVITGDLLSKHVADRGIVRISPAAILTPTAQDWLRNRNVEVIRDGRTSRNTTPSARWLAIVHSGSESAATVLSDIGRMTDVSLTTESAETATEAARRAVLDLRSGEAHGIVAFSSAAESIACLANREICVRAAAVKTVDDVRRVTTLMGCNLLALDAEGLGFFELRNLLKTALSEPIPTAPDGWT
ncbi:MAG: hypothetical protein VB858_09300 [Planctomycetaceae bacterium]